MQLLGNATEAKRQIIWEQAGIGPDENSTDQLVINRLVHHSLKRKGFSVALKEDHALQCIRIDFHLTQHPKDVWEFAQSLKETIKELEGKLR